MSAFEQMAASDKPSTEIERKFLVPVVPAWLDQYPTRRILQGYLPTEDDDTEVRVRMEGDVNHETGEVDTDGAKYTRTVKSKGGLVRSEVEALLTADEFGAQWPETEGHRVEKDRTEVPYDGRTMEVDRYLGKLAGHAVAEVEFDTVAEARAFVPPEWIGEDVTAFNGLKNYALATRGWPAEYLTNNSVTPATTAES